VPAEAREAQRSNARAAAAAASSGHGALAASTGGAADGPAGPGINAAASSGASTSNTDSIAGSSLPQPAMVPRGIRATNSATESLPGVDGLTQSYDGLLHVGSPAVFSTPSAVTLNLDDVSSPPHGHQQPLQQQPAVRNGYGEVVRRDGTAVVATETPRDPNAAVVLRPLDAEGAGAIAGVLGTDAAYGTGKAVGLRAFHFFFFFFFFFFFLVFWGKFVLFF
jgi:hypothetical protein